MFVVDFLDKYFAVGKNYVFETFLFGLESKYFGVKNFFLFANDELP